LAAPLPLLCPNLPLSHETCFILIILFCFQW
jgi:hypothetical protein